MNICVSCSKEFSDQKNGYRYKSNKCDECFPSLPFGFPSVKTTVWLCGGEEKTTQAEINEIERRVILPVNPTAKDDVTYYVGRKGENGKLEERLPSI